MYPAQFDYHRASSVAQALDLLASKQDAKLLAGGHSLLPMMKLRLAQPANLIDIGGIAELSGIEKSGSGVRIGALTTHADIAGSDLLKRTCPIVAEAAAKIGDQQVRNRGTIGGNLTHADPGSDLPAVVKALDATLHLVSKKGKRAVKASEFFVDLLTSAVGEGEILTAVEVPALGDGVGAAYLKFEHPASGYAVVGAAAIVRLGKDGRCESARLCFNGVTATPLDAQQVASALAGKTLDDAAIDQAVNANLTAPDPMGDVFASGEYRVHLAKVFGRRALKLARDRAS
jgi:carbon-monoxide dehydrogenase medium subunit